MKNKKILISIVVLVLVVLLGVFVIYPKFIKNNSNNKINEISLNDDRVVDLIKKIDFDNLILASIYKNGDFDRDTIPNDLILKIGFNGGLDWKKDGELINETSNNDYNSDYRWLIPKELIDKEIKSIFGDIQYQHNSLIVNNFTNDFGGPSTSLSGNFENNQYEIGLVFGHNPRVIINQEPYKAESANDNKKISIYVKTFYSTDACQLGDDMNVYKSYDFNNKKLNDDYMFMQNVNKSNMECLKEQNIDITGLETYDEYISEIEPEKLKNYDFFDKLDSYVYTFELSDDGNYYLSSFKKVTK